MKQVTLEDLEDLKKDVLKLTEEWFRQMEAMAERIKDLEER